jgi:nucleoside-diphosphate kinase
MKSLVLLKPDVVDRRLVGQLFGYFESNLMFKIVATKMVMMDVNLCRQHYVDHLEKPFYVGLEQFMTSGPLFAMVVEGNVDEIRKTALALRGIFNADKSGPRNLTHASDSEAAAAREVALWFPELGGCDGR